MDMISIRRRVLMASKKEDSEPYPVGAKFAVGTYENTNTPASGSYRDCLIPVRGGMVLHRTGGQRLYGNNFYDKDMNFISRYDPPAGTTSDIDIPVPDGAYWYDVSVNYPSKLWTVYLERIA